MVTIYGHHRERHETECIGGEGSIHSFIANVFPKFSHNNDIQYSEKENAELKQLINAFPQQLKVTFRQYPAIHTNYIISHYTTLQYNHTI